MTKKHKLDGTEPFIETIKSMIEDKSMLGWLMVFAGVPFIVLGILLEGSYDWHIYLSYIGGGLVVAGFVWGAIKS